MRTSTLVNLGDACLYYLVPTWWEQGELEGAHRLLLLVPNSVRDPRAQRGVQLLGRLVSMWPSGNPGGLGPEGCRQLTTARQRKARESLNIWITIVGEQLRGRLRVPRW